MKLNINNIKDLRTKCENLKERSYKTVGPQYEGRTVSKIVFERKLKMAKSVFYMD